MKKRILGILLSLILIVGLLPTAALAEESTLNEDKLSDNTQITSENDITRAQLAEMVYEHESLKTDIDSMGYGGTEPQFNDITDCTEDQKAAITALYKAKIISGTAENAFSPQGTVTAVNLPWYCGEPPVPEATKQRWKGALLINWNLGMPPLSTAFMAPVW